MSAPFTPTWPLSYPFCTRGEDEHTQTHRYHLWHLWQPESFCQVSYEDHSAENDWMELRWSRTRIPDLDLLYDPTTTTETLIARFAQCLEAFSLDALHALGFHPSAPTTLIEGAIQIMVHDWHEWNWQLLKHPRISSTFLESLLVDDTLPPERRSALLWHVGRHPQCPPRTIRALWHPPVFTLNPDDRGRHHYLYDNGTIRQALVSNPSCPRQLLTWALQQRQHPYDQALAQNPSFPHDIRTTVETRASTNLHLFLTLLTRPDCPRATLQQAAEHPQEVVRAAVAEHPSLDPDTLDRLSRGWSVYVRQAVARNPRTAGETLARLVRSQVPTIRADAFWHPHLPQRVRSTLMRMNQVPDLPEDDEGYPTLYLEPGENLVGPPQLMPRRCDW